jgi:hypothetical protein
MSLRNRFTQGEVEQKITVEQYRNIIRHVRLWEAGADLAVGTDQEQCIGSVVRDQVSAGAERNDSAGAPELWGMGHNLGGYICGLAFLGGFRRLGVRRGLLLGLRRWSKFCDERQVSRSRLLRGTLSNLLRRRLTAKISQESRTVRASETRTRIPTLSSVISSVAAGYDVM